MITCTVCHKFVKEPRLKINTFSYEILEAKGHCKVHGWIDVDYDSYEEWDDPRERNEEIRAEENKKGEKEEKS